jgi:uncharacterized protein
MRIFIFLFFLQLYHQNASGQDSLAFDVFSIGHRIRLHSEILHEDRILNIYLPHGYAENQDTAYDVVYLLDGSSDEDFLHVSGIVQYLSFPWLGQCNPTIVVGIENVDRRRDFTFETQVEADHVQWPTTGGSAVFIRFLDEELQPYIDQHYRTTYRKILIGQSLGGLLGCQIYLESPSLFSDYLLISPSLWWDNESLIERYKQHDPVVRPFTANLLLAYGDEGKIMKRDIKKLHRIVKHKQAIPGHTTLRHLKGYQHGDIGHTAVMELMQEIHRIRSRRARF